MNSEDPARHWGCSQCGRPETERPETPEADRRAARRCASGGCPWPGVSPAAYTLIGIWNEWELIKLLPYPGGLANQPAWVVDVLTALTLDARKLEADALRNPRPAAATSSPTNIVPPTISWASPAPKKDRAK